MSVRIEKDFLGEQEIPSDVYYGINTFRAIDNFNVTDRKVHFDIIKAMIIIKKAAAYANMESKSLDTSIGNYIIEACDKALDGGYDNQFVIPAIQGGAGTSVNMNVNEVISNIALELVGRKKGEYEYIHPINHVNMSQSTNDTFPTAIKIAAIWNLKKLTEAFANLQEALQIKEDEFSNIIKCGRTELQDAVPVMLGQEFGAYAQAIARDRWRLYKAEERLRQINIGGTAIGTGLNADLNYIYEITEKLREFTGLGISRSEYNIDTTQNMDVFVEVSGLLKTSAVNLCKISNDLRLMSSGPKAGFGELILPKVQAGSSIMPGKVNPVIPEMINHVSYEVMSNDLAITLAASSGQFELNAMLPLIGDKIIDSINILNKSIKIFIKKCINDIQPDEKRCRELLENSYAMATALVPHIGYDKASEISKHAIEKEINIRDAAKEMTDLTEEELNKIFNSYNMTTPGIRNRK